MSNKNENTLSTCDNVQPEKGGGPCGFVIHLLSPVFVALQPGRHKRQFTIMSSTQTRKGANGCGRPLEFVHFKNGDNKVLKTPENTHLQNLAGALKLAAYASIAIVLAFGFGLGTQHRDEDEIRNLSK